MLLGRVLNAVSIASHVLTCAIATLLYYSDHRKRERHLLRERLARLEHEQWVAWSGDIATSEQITPARLNRWTALWRPYAELTETEKDQDREWADRVLAILQH